MTGVWCAAFHRGLLIWALGKSDGAEFIESRSGLAVALPHHAAWTLHAAQEFGPFLLTVALFAASAWLALRLAGAWSLAASFIAFWLAVPTFDELVRYGWSRRSSLELLSQSLGIPQPGEVGQQVLAAVSGLAIVLLLRAGLRRSGLPPLTAFACPAWLLYALSDASLVHARFLDRIGIDHFPAVLALVTALAAAKPRPDTERPSTLGAVALAVTGLLAYAAPVPSPTPSSSVAWTDLSSGSWSIRFEAASFLQQRREDWIAGADERLRSYRERLGLPSDAKPIPVQVADSERALVPIVPNRQGARGFGFDIADRGVLMSTPAGVPEDLREEALLAMRHAWGNPGSTAMALALARYAIGTFEGGALADAATSIACEETRYSEKAVFSVDRGFLSPLVRDAAGGAWVEKAVERHGPAVVATLYRQSLPESLAMCVDCVPECGTAVYPSKSHLPPASYLKGVSFSHEGGGTGGYGSESARLELARIRDIGANAIALVPYAFTAAPEAEFIRFRTLETDARLLRSGRQARELGMLVMLKPHLWAGRRFHGEIAFTEKSRFDTWFDDYRRWMLHYARLAEIGRFEVLAIGNELAGLTVHERDWRSLIAEVRRIYRGPLTYAAHWETEVESLGFWDALDYIGVNFYFPLAAPGQSLSRDSPEILRAAQTIERVQARFGKPVLYTEVGFPALATAAERPWEENSSALDTGLQARCYAVWMERFARNRNVAGMFWWKWPSHGRGSPFDPSHRPLAKPAVDVLANWFGRL